MLSPVDKRLLYGTRAPRTLKILLEVTQEDFSYSYLVKKMICIARFVFQEKMLQQGPSTPSQMSLADTLLVEFPIVHEYILH